MNQDKRERWDAIVIGSGLGGLSTAAYLCAGGKRTLVLESHHVAGGNSQVFRRRIQGKDYEFDVGIHYIGECGPGGLISNILNGAGLAERVVFRPMDPDGYSTLIFPDFRFRVPNGWDRYRERLLEAFPEEAQGLGQVVDVLEQVAEKGRRMLSGEMSLNDLAEKAPIFMQWGLRPVTDLFKEYGLSERATAVILGEQGTYAVRPSKTPVALAAGLTDHYMRGAFYPEGGGQVLAGRFVEAIRAYGGEIRTRARVKKVRVEKGRVTGVILDKGDQEIDAPVVVSNADLKRTVLELVGPENFQPDTIERVRSYRMALGLFCVYLGLDIDLRAQGVPNTNYFVSDSYDVEGMYDKLEAGEMPDELGAYRTIASLKDPESKHLAPEGYTNLQVMTVVPREYGIWNVGEGPVKGSNRYHVDPEYRRRKNELADLLLERAERALPGIREHIDWRETATPVTQERFTRSTGGTSYGVEFSTDQMGPMRMGADCEIPGLYFCGASTQSGHGIGGVLRSGVIAAGAVLETDLLRAVHAGEIFGDRSLLPELREGWDSWRESL
jgi:phytoene dehydrogenase-like protein